MILGKAEFENQVEPGALVFIEVNWSQLDLILR